jgi:hypothetical protein
MGGCLGLVYCSQERSTLVLHTKDILFCNTSSLEGMIFVSLRQDFESLVGLFFYLLHLHTPKFYCNNPTWFYGQPTSPWKSTGHKILKGACLRWLEWESIHNELACWYDLCYLSFGSSG